MQHMEPDPNKTPGFQTALQQLKETTDVHISKKIFINGKLTFVQCLDSSFWWFFKYFGITFSLVLISDK